MTTLLATFFGVGFLRPAPGTWGSLVAVVVAGFLFYGIGPWAFIVPLVLIAIFGVPICVRYMQQTQKHDPSEVVIDEVLGLIIIVMMFIGVGGLWLYYGDAMWP